MIRNTVEDDKFLVLTSFYKARVWWWFIRWHSWEDYNHIPVENGLATIRAGIDSASFAPYIEMLDGMCTYPKEKIVERREYRRLLELTTTIMAVKLCNSLPSWSSAYRGYPLRRANHQTSIGIIRSHIYSLRRVSNHRSKNSSGNAIWSHNGGSSSPLPLIVY